MEESNQTHTPDPAEPIAASKFSETGSSKFLNSKFRHITGTSRRLAMLSSAGIQTGKFPRTWRLITTAHRAFCLGNEYSVAGRRTQRTRNRKPRNSNAAGENPERNFSRRLLVPWRSRRHFRGQRDVLTPFFLTTRSGDEILVLTARFGNRSCERGFPDAVCALDLGPRGTWKPNWAWTPPPRYPGRLDAASAVAWRFRRRLCGRLRRLSGNFGRLRRPGGSTTRCTTAAAYAVEFSARRPSSIRPSPLESASSSPPAR